MDRFLQKSEYKKQKVGFDMGEWLVQFTRQGQVSDLIGQLIFWLKHSGWIAVMSLVFIVALSGLIYYKAQTERTYLKDKEIGLIFSFPTWWFALVWMFYAACAAFPSQNRADTYAFSVYLIPVEMILIFIGVWTTAGQSLKLVIPISILRFSLVGLPIILISLLMALASKILIVIAVALVFLFIFLI